MEFFMRKLSKVFLIIFSLLFAFTTIYGQDKLFTKKKNNFIREGAGSYYPILEILPAGVPITVIENKGQWLRVELDKSESGWLSKSSTQDSKPLQIDSKLASKWSSAKVSKISLAGAIKGLLGKSNAHVEGNTDRLLQLLHRDITPFQIQNFINDLDRYESDNREEVDLDDIELEVKLYDPDLEELQIGFGVASRIVMQPIVQNKEINNYITLIGRALLDKSEFYDWEFNILMLDDSKADGFACPGGYIFITKGLFLASSDEAEFAASIAHELAHIILQHGSSEIEERKNIMKMDDAFAELDDELGESESIIENELDDLIASSYEKVVRKRTLEYEYEADLLAAILLANAGYDPFAIGRLTQKLSSMFRADIDIFSDDYLAPNEVKKRAEKIKIFLEDNFEKDEPGSTFESRFNNYYKKVY